MIFIIHWHIFFRIIGIEVLSSYRIVCPWYGEYFKFVRGIANSIMCKRHLRFWHVCISKYLHPNSKGYVTCFIELLYIKFNFHTLLGNFVNISQTNPYCVWQGCMEISAIPGQLCQPGEIYDQTNSCSSVRAGRE